MYLLRQTDHNNGNGAIYGYGYGFGFGYGSSSGDGNGYGFLNGDSYGSGKTNYKVHASPNTEPFTPLHILILIRFQKGDTK